MAAAFITSLLLGSSLAAAHSAPRPRQVSTNGVSIANGRTTPWNLTAETWAQLMANPNLKGSWPIQGFNISNAEYHDPDLEWTVTLSVQEEIPAEGNIESRGTDSIFAGSMYRLEPPENLIQPALDKLDEERERRLDEDRNGGRYGGGRPDWFSIKHRSWDVCQILYNLRREEDRNMLEDDDGSCSSIFSDDCRRAIEEERGISFSDDEGPCSIQPLPSECDWHGGAASNPAAFQYSRWNDVEDVDWLQGTELRSVATEATPPDWEPNLRKVTQHVDFMIISFVHNEGGRSRVKNSLVCPKRLNATSDEEEAEDQDGNDEAADDDGDSDGDADGDGNGDGDEDIGTAMLPSLASVVLGAALSAVYLLAL